MLPSSDATVRSSTADTSGPSESPTSAYSPSIVAKSRCPGATKQSTTRVEGMVVAANSRAADPPDRGELSGLATGKVFGLRATEPGAAFKELAPVCCDASEGARIGARAGESTGDGSALGTVTPKTLVPPAGPEKGMVSPMGAATEKTASICFVGDDAMAVFSFKPRVVGDHQLTQIAKLQRSSDDFFLFEARSLAPARPLTEVAVELRIDCMFVVYHITEPPSPPSSAG